MAGIAPRSVSERGYLREGLPVIYREDEFAMRFVQALEEVLDPIVCLLDALPAHFDPQLAPPDVLELLGAWLGLEVDETTPAGQRRTMVRHAMELARTRGTRVGLELTLRLTFPDLALDVHDQGGVSWSAAPAAPPASPAAFEVVSHEPLTAEQRAAVERVIALVKPAHVAHTTVEPGGTGE